MKINPALCRLAVVTTALSKVQWHSGGGADAGITSGRRMGASSAVFYRWLGVTQEAAGRGHS